MYEMRAEFDPAKPDFVLMWHALPKNSAGLTLCGRLLPPSQAVVKPQDAPTDQYCPPCIALVGQAMEAAAH
ncbi:hypothetical protein [Kitasatospora sp. NPDC050463]|uniref:hypothetical protein n=1 Tax=Kitasatospora sp. NPDC050463 TaxID=3155786 RepID=UPI0033FC50AD